MKSSQILMMNGDQPDPASGFGYVYNKYCIFNSDFLPTDYEIPTNEDWDTLKAYVTDGGDLKESGYIHWMYPNSDADNSSGFTAYAGGYRSSGGDFASMFRNGYFAGVNSVIPTYYSCLYLYSYSSTIDIIAPSTGYSFSVRAIYRGSGTPTSVTDYDGNELDVVLIGTQYWVAENWKCTHLNDGTAITNKTDADDWSSLTTEGYCAYNNNEKYV